MKRAAEFFIGGTVVYLAMAACAAGGPSLGDNLSSGTGGTAGGPTAQGGANPGRAGHEGVAGRDGIAGGSGGIFDPVPPAMAAPKSGSRLKAKTYKGSDGSEMPTFLWQDVERNEECSFGPAADGTTRCLPRAASAAYFADSSCTTPASLAPSSACGTATVKYAGTSEQTSCGVRTRLFELGGPLSALYFGSSASCYAFPIPAGSLAYGVGAEVSPSVFVEAQVVTEQ